MTKQNIIFITGFALFLTSNFLHLTPTALAVGLQVKPSEIRLESQVGQKISARLLVFNPSPEVSVFDVYPDSFESQIKTSPSSFILESGESREVSASFEFQESGQFQTDLSVVARPLSKNSLSAGGGLKIPVLINVQIKKNNLLASVFNWFGQSQNSLIGILVFLAILFLLFRFSQSLVKKNKFPAA